MQTSAPTHDPVPGADGSGQGERFEALDVLRGLAVLGILIVNAPGYAMPSQVSGEPTLSPLPFGPGDQAVWWGMRTFFEQKFVTLFAMLFGASVFLVGGERGQDPTRARVLRRRLAWLMLFGALHGALIWEGDILFLYGAVGWLMLLCRSWPARRLLWVGALLVLVTTALFIGPSIAFQQAEDAAAQARKAAEVSGAIAEHRSGFGGSTGVNFREWAISVVPITILFGPITLGLMMWGLALLRWGVLQGRAGARTYRLLVLAGGAALAVVGWSAWDMVRDGFPGETSGYDLMANFTLAAVVTLGYVGLVILGLRSPAVRPALLLLAPVGRLAFTNYIAQSVIMTTIFHTGRGLGLFGRLD